MLSRKKVTDHMIEQHGEDESSDLARFIDEFLIQMEFGAFDPDDDEQGDDF